MAIYIEESKVPPAIEGVDLSVATFVGVALRGPMEQPTTITSWVQFEREWGGLSAAAELGYGVAAFFANGGRKAQILRVSDTRETASAEAALGLLRNVEALGLLCLPGVTEKTMLLAAAELCREHRGFLIVDPPPERGADALAASVDAGDVPRTAHAAAYWPRLVVADPLGGGRTRAVAPSGAVAGVIARTDETRGVWRPPAGSEARVAGGQALEFSVDETHVEHLRARGVNCIRPFRDGHVLWGVRTLEGDPTSDWKYINVRRTADYIERSIADGIRWAVFEPNGEALRDRLRQVVEGFLNTLWRNGAFVGETPAQAYFVRCEPARRTDGEIDQGRVDIVVGFAPLRPAEFVVIHIACAAAPAARKGDGA